MLNQISLQVICFRKDPFINVGYLQIIKSKLNCTTPKIIRRESKTE